MNKKLAVVVIVLVLSTGVIPGVISNNPSFGTTIYVDDDNIMGPWDGSKEHPFQFIQDAVDNASEGDTIYVYSGTYYENAIVDKAINLIGENKEATIIDGNKNGNVIHIIADEVTISDFTLQHYGTIWFDSGIKIESDDNTITNNNIYGNYDGACYNSTGIYVINSNHNFVENNHILHNSYGIFNTDSKLSIFSANQIINNNDGICILNSNNNEIKNNEFIKNNNCAIVLHSSNGNSIYTNNIKLGVWVGIDLNGANTNTIKRNNIIENSRYGLRIRGSKYNVVTENNFIQNYEQAFLLSSQRTAINNNYWDDWNNLFLPRPINCTINPIYMLLPWFKFDWHPAKELFDIQNMGE